MTLGGEIAAAIATLPKRDVPAARLVRRRFSHQLRGADPGLVLAAAEELAGSDSDLVRLVGYELVAAHPQARERLTAARLKRLAGKLDSWGSVDCFACFLSGPAWRGNQISAGVIRSWARSRDRWWRRAALVSTVPLNNRTRGGEGDPRRTLMICTLLVHDRDDMVEKALSWALRELAKRDAAAVRKFLVQHRWELSARVRREVDNKLRTGLKHPQRRPAN